MITAFVQPASRTKYDREAISSVYLTGRGERSFFDMRGYYFKGLSTTDFQKQQPLVHPVIDYNKRVDGPDALGGEVEIDVNFTSLSREASQFRAAAPRRTRRNLRRLLTRPARTGTFNRDQCLLPGVAGNYSRLTTQVSWKRRYIDDLGQSWTPFAFARADAIWSSPQSTGFQNANTASLMGPSDRFHGRFTPGVGLGIPYAADRAGRQFSARNCWSRWRRVHRAPEREPHRSLAERRCTEPRLR